MLVLTCCKAWLYQWALFPWVNLPLSAGLWRWNGGSNWRSSNIISVLCGISSHQKVLSKVETGWGLCFRTFFCEQCGRQTGGGRTWRRVGVTAVSQREGDDIAWGCLDKRQVTDDFKDLLISLWRKRKNKGWLLNFLAWIAWMGERAVSWEFV